MLKYMQIAVSSDKERRKKFGKEAPSGSQEDMPVREAFRLPDPYLLNKFVDEFLKPDGVCLLLYSQMGEEGVGLRLPSSFLWQNWCSIYENFFTHV